MTEKLKKSPARLGTIPFLLLWSACNAAGWLAMLWMWSQFGMPFERAAHPLFSLIPVSVAAVGQALLLRYGLKKSEGWMWLPVSITGGIAIVMSTAIVIRSGVTPHIAMLAYTFPATIVQAIWLHRYVKSAWLWVAGGIAGTMVVTMILLMGIPDLALSFTIVGLAQGIMTGVIMRHLWTQERSKEKHKIAADALTDDDHAERIERLHDAAPDKQDDVEAESLARLLRS